MIEQFSSVILDKSKDYIIFDIGSRDCEQSIEFYNTFPNAKIYAFECNPNTLPLCRKNIEKYSDRITLVEGAVSDYDGTITFYPINQEKTVTSWKDGNPGASSLFKTNGTYNIEHYVQDTITTNCHRLDTIMNKYNIPKVDIIWMDLQGAELMALKGLGDFINTLVYLHTEVSHAPMYTGQAMFSDIHPFMCANKFLLKNKLSMRGWQEDAIYEKKYLYDIVIPVGPNDTNKIVKQIEYTKKNIIGYRNIYIISHDPTLSIDGCKTISESIFPFSLDTVASYHGKISRNGWYLQQLLKLYAGIIIPDILDKYLVIDADTFFLKPTSFIENDKALYNYGNEYHLPYFDHMKRLHPSLTKLFPTKSGVCHHMLFETKFIKELFEMIETNKHELFYISFLKHVVDYNESGASEYEIYFNYMFTKHPDKIQLRPLKWANSNYIPAGLEYDYISCHWYL